MKYEYWLACLQGISCRKKRALLSHVSCARDLYFAGEESLKEWGLEEMSRIKLQESRRTWKLEAEAESLQKKGIRFITIEESGYPRGLREIPSPPYAIFVKGKLPQEERHSVAIVGARECSPYGRRMAEEFGERLSEAGIQIVSGMARGIDSAGQKGALRGGGTSFGVLACGVDICYPRENIELYMELKERGGLLSEMPPGTQPLPQFFPARNRIISGLSDAILVMEAKERSGSLITADMALEQGKDVYALPGPLTSHLSYGCHNLIRQGAGILLSPKDLLEDLGIFHKESIEKTEENKISLESTEKLVYSGLDFEPKCTSDILEQTGLTIPALMSTLVSLELKGIVKEISKNYYVKVK